MTARFFPVARSIDSILIGVLLYRRLGDIDLSEDLPVRLSETEKLHALQDLADYAQR